MHGQGKREEADLPPAHAEHASGLRERRLPERGLVSRPTFTTPLLCRTSITSTTTLYWTSWSAAITTGWSLLRAIIAFTSRTSVSRLTFFSAPPRSRSRSRMLPSCRISTSSGLAGGWLLRLTEGRSTMLVLMSGAVTMKITSSTASRRYRARR
jgi:hypothetical protein